ncbi:MAG: PIN domain protein [Gammaproteobacteria bacterium]|nr:PIN domain protein [Gammaproteobacteria bacterium]
MKLYLDNCCFNRPFDDQSNFRIQLETEAKLRIQDDIRNGHHQLVWSYVLEYENSKNPYRERREQIDSWIKYAVVDLVSSAEIRQQAKMAMEIGLKQMDAFHLGCAIVAGCEVFLTTDKGISKRANLFSAIQIFDPIRFIQETTP